MLEVTARRMREARRQPSEELLAGPFFPSARLLEGGGAQTVLYSLNFTSVLTEGSFFPLAIFLLFLAIRSLLRGL